MLNPRGCITYVLQLASAAEDSRVCVWSLPHAQSPPELKFSARYAGIVRLKSRIPTLMAVGVAFADGDICVGCYDSDRLVVFERRS